MSENENPDQSSGCTARSKRSGLRCKNRPVRGAKVCRMHGAGGGAPTGEANGNYRHGGRTKQAKAVKDLIRAALAFARNF
jgi:hypothetical protein